MGVASTAQALHEPPAVAAPVWSDVTSGIAAGVEVLISARHAVLSQGAKQVPPHFLAWPETFGRTDSKRCRRSREINDFHLPPAQTPRTLFRDHYGISEIRRHPSSFDADV
jgi:hypothetical protein